MRGKKEKGEVRYRERDSGKDKQVAEEWRKSERKVWKLGVSERLRWSEK